MTHAAHDVDTSPPSDGIDGVDHVVLNVIVWAQAASTGPTVPKPG